MTYEEAEKWLLEHRASVYFYPTRAEGKVAVNYNPPDVRLRSGYGHAEANTFLEAVEKAMEQENDINQH